MVENGREEAGTAMDDGRKWSLCLKEVDEWWWCWWKVVAVIAVCGGGGGGGGGIEANNVRIELR